MMQGVYLFVGLIATVVSIVTVGGGLRGDMSATAGVVSASLGIVIWGVFAFASFNVEVVSAGGEVVSRSYDSMAMIGTLAAAGMAIALYKAALATYEDLGAIS